MEKHKNSVHRAREKIPVVRLNACKYDEEHPWLIEKEIELGNKFREKGELTKEDLLEMIKR